MKHFIFIICFFIAEVELFAQKVDSNDVPAPVKNGLEMNMHIKEAKWEKEGANYEANFKKSGKEMSVLFDEQGVMLETEIEISRSELPSVAKNILKIDYSSYKVEEIEKVISRGNHYL